MGNINYDSFYKFLVSIGIVMAALPVTVCVFLLTDSFNLQISETDLATYTQTAQEVIKHKQNIPLLIEKWYVKFIFIIFMTGGSYLVFWGLKKWYELQKLDDIIKRREYEKSNATINKKIENMSDEQIIRKNGLLEESGSTVAKNLLIKQKVLHCIINSKPSYIVRNNITIDEKEYDIVALSPNRFEKDYIYEVKYSSQELTSGQIENYREKMKDLKSVYMKKFDRIPYMILEIIVPDIIYEHTLRVAGEVEKRNNYSIEIRKESDLEKRQ